VQLDLWPVYTFHFTDQVLNPEAFSHGSFRQYIKDNVVNVLSTFVYPCPAQNEYFSEWPDAATDIRTNRMILLCTEMMTDLRQFAHDIEAPELFSYARLPNQATVLSDFIFTDKTCKGKYDSPCEHVALNTFMRRFSGAPGKLDAEYIDLFLSNNKETLYLINAQAALVSPEPNISCHKLGVVSSKLVDILVVSAIRRGDDEIQDETAARFYAIVVHPDCDGCLDKCPIYIFDLLGGKIQNGVPRHPRGVYGNFRKWMEGQLQTYLEWVGERSEIVGAEEEEILQRARAMYDDLQCFSMDYIRPTKEWEQTVLQDLVILM
jgi:hypothetical protein